ITYLSLGNACTIAAQISVVLQCCPGDGVMTVTESKDPAEAHHGIQDATGDLVDQQVIDFTDTFIANSVDIRSLNILTRYESPVRVCRCLCHHGLSSELRLPDNRRRDASVPKSRRRSTCTGFGAAAIDRCRDSV